MDDDDGLGCARGIVHALLIEGLVVALLFAGAFYELTKGGIQ